MTTPAFLPAAALLPILGASAKTLAAVLDERELMGAYPLSYAAGRGRAL